MRLFARENREDVVHLFATLGDSITAGTSRDNSRLWPQLVTDWLSIHSPGVRLLNFATNGAVSSDVIRDQVPRALEQRPDLITVICGANDVLYYPRPDINAAAANLTECLRRLADEIPDRIVTATYPDFVPFLPWRPRSKARVEAGLTSLNEMIRLAAHKIGVPCVDLAAISRRYSSKAYDRDGVHPSQAGHQGIATAMTLTLATHLNLPAPIYWGPI